MSPPARTPERSFTPSMQQLSPQTAAVQLQTGAGGSFAELSMFVKEQQTLLIEQQTLLLEQQKEQIMMQLYLC